MNSSLIGYIFMGRRNRYAAILDSWIASCKEYGKFVRLYRDKIRKKINETTNNDVLADILFELEVAYLLCQNERFGLEYEKAKSTTDRSPDFVLSFDRAIDIGIEVKRIREPFASVRYNALIQDIVDEVQKIPSSLGFSLNWDELDATPKIVEELDSKKESIIRYIVEIIRDEESRIDVGSGNEYSLPGFYGKFVLLLTKPLGKINASETSYNGGFRPSLYTQREYQKFSDAILDKIHQMIANRANVVVITSDSTTHEVEDLYQAINVIVRFANKRDDAFFIRKGFQDTEDFLQYWKRLSAIVFRSIWISVSNRTDRNALWQNEYAEYQIPGSAADYFKRMGGARLVA